MLVPYCKTTKDCCSVNPLFFGMNIVRDDIEVGKCWGFCRGGCVLKYICSLALESTG